MSAPVTTAAAGTTLTRGSTVAAIVNIKGGGVEVGSRNTTNLGSTWKSCAPVLPKGKPLTITVNYSAAAHAAYLADAAAGTIASTVLYFPSDTGGTASSTITFSAFISSVEFGGMSEDGTITCDVEFTPTDAVTVS